MTDDFTTISGIESVLAATADYDVNNSTSNASRRATALRRKLDFAQSSSRNSQSIQYDTGAIERQLQQVLDWLSARTTQSTADRLRRPSVVHADFSRTGKYAGGDV